MLDEVTPGSAIRSARTDKHWIVCGWFTEDKIYRPLAQNLATSLDRVGAPYDLVSVPKIAGGWEASIRAKPQQARLAMHRHPDKTIIFMDIDFTAKGDLEWLADAPGDIALRIVARRRRRVSRLHFSSQVIVIKPTRGARSFMDAWLRLNSEARPGDWDEASLGLAFAATTDCAVGGLDKERLASVLTHSLASHFSEKMSVGRRFFLQALQKIGFHP